jgi:hypothetical protein
VSHQRCVVIGREYSMQIEVEGSFDEHGRQRDIGTPRGPSRA